MNRTALHTLPLEDIYAGYGVPNDLLVTLGLHGMRVLDVPIEPIYGRGEQSKMSIPRVSLSLSTLLIRLGWRRLRRLLFETQKLPADTQINGKRDPVPMLHRRAEGHGPRHKA